jgi:uncharacterized protein
MNDQPIFQMHRDDFKFLSACAIELCLGVLAIALGMIFGPDARAQIPSIQNFQSVALGVGAGCAAGAILALVMVLAQQIPLPSLQRFQERTTHQLFQLLSGLSLPQLMVVALTAGVGEELLFRGWLMQFLTGDLKECSPTCLLLGLVISSIVFGFAHPLHWLYITVAGLMGLVFGTLYWYFNNLLVPIVAHWVYDAIMIVWLMRYSAYSQAGIRL